MTSDGSQRGRSHLLRILILILGLLAVAVVASGTVAATEEITECTTIDESGEYELADDLGDGSNYCLNVTADDVTLSGNGHQLGDGLSIQGDDVTVTELTIDSAEFPLAIDNAGGTTVRNVAVLDNEEPIAFTGATGSSITDLTVLDAQREGIEIVDSHENTFAEFVIESEDEGFLLDSSDDNRLENGSIESTDDIGIEGDGSNNEITGLTIKADDEGIAFDGFSNQFWDLDVTSDDDGSIELYGDENELWDSSLSSQEEGLFIEGDDTDARDLEVSTVDDGVVGEGTGNDYENLHVSTTDGTGMDLDRGDQATISDITIDSGGSGLDAGGDGVEVANVAIDSGGTGLEVGDGSVVTDAEIESGGEGLRIAGDDNSIEDVVIESSGDGVRVSGYSENNIENVEIESEGDGLRLEGSDSEFRDGHIEAEEDGVRIDGGDNHFSDIQIESGEDGVQLTSGDHNTITNVDLMAEEDGLRIGGDHNDISNIIVTVEDSGVAFGSGAYNELSNAKITAGSTGIDLDRDHNVVSDVEVTAEEVGIELDDDNVSVQEAVIEAEEIGIQVGSSQEATIANSNVVSGSLEFGWSVEDATVDTVEIGEATISATIDDIDDLTIEPSAATAADIDSLDRVDGDLTITGDDAEGLDIEHHYDPDSVVADEVLLGELNGTWRVIDETSDDGQETVASTLGGDGTYGLVGIGEKAILECTSIEEAGTYDLVTDLTSDDICIWLSADDVDFQGHGNSITGEDTESWAYGVRSTDQDNVAVSDVTVRGWENQAGVGFLGVEEGTITGVTSVENEVGIELTEISSDVDISDNRLIDNTQRGIYILDSQATVTDNHLEGSQTGVEVGFGSGTYIGNNTLDNEGTGGTGIELEYSNDVTIVDTVLEHNTVGLDIQDSDGVSIESVELSGPLTNPTAEFSNSDIEATALDLQGDVVSFSGTGASLEGNGQPADSPSGLRDVGTSVDLRDVEGDVDIGLHYDEGMAALIDGDMELHQDSVGWADLDATDDRSAMVVEGTSEGWEGVVGAYGEEGNVVECGDVIDESGEWAIGEDLEYANPCIEITAPDVTLFGNGHEIEGTSGDDGIRIEGDGATVRNLSIVYSEDAVAVEGATGTTLNDIEMEEAATVLTLTDADNTTVTELVGTTVAWAGIELTNSENVSIDGATVTGSGDELLAIEDGSHGTEVTDVEILNSTSRPVQVEGSNETLFENVRIENSTYPVVMAESHGLTMTNTSLVDTRFDLEDSTDVAMSNLSVGGYLELDGVDNSSMNDVFVDDSRLRLHESNDNELANFSISGDDGISQIQSDRNQFMDVEIQGGGELLLGGAVNNQFTAIDIDDAGITVDTGSHENQFDDAVVDGADDSGIGLYAEGNTFEDIIVRNIGSEGNGIEIYEENNSFQNVIIDDIDTFDPGTPVILDGAANTTIKEIGIDGEEPADHVFDITDSPDSEFESVLVRDIESSSFDPLNTVFKIENSPYTSFVDVALEEVDDAFILEGGDKSYFDGISVREGETIFDVDQSANSTYTNVAVENGGDVFRISESPESEFSGIEVHHAGDVFDLRYDNEDSTITDVSVAHVGDAIEIDNSDRSTVQDVAAVNVGDGVEIDESDESSLANIEMIDVDGVGLEVDGSDDVIVEQLSLENVEDIGIEVDDSIATEISNASVQQTFDNGIEVTGTTTNLELSSVHVSDSLNMDLVVEDDAISTEADRLTLGTTPLSFEADKIELDSSESPLAPDDDSIRVGSVIAIDPIDVEGSIAAHYDYVATDIDEDTLAFWDGVADQTLDSTVDTDRQVVEASIEDSSQYAIVAEEDDGTAPGLAPPAPDDDEDLAPASFTISNQSVEPAALEPGDEVTVSMTVTNTGEEAGSYDLNLTADGTIVAEETVVLAGDESETVSMTHTIAEEGDVTLAVNGEEFETVSATEPEPEPEPEEEEDDEEDDSGLPGIVLVLAGVIVVGAGAAGWLYTQGHLDQYLEGVGESSHQDPDGESTTGDTGKTAEPAETSAEEPDLGNSDTETEPESVRDGEAGEGQPDTDEPETKADTDDSTADRPDEE